VRLLGLDGTDSGFAWASGDGGVILRSTDFGATWTQVYALAGRDFRSVVAFNETTAIAVGASYVSPYGVGARTTDGSTWSAFTPPNNSNGVQSAAGAPGTSVATMMVSGGLYRSTDYGVTWNVVAAPGVHSNFRTLTMPDSSTVYMTGNGGIRVSLDGGSTYRSISTNYHQGYAIAAWDRARIVSGGDGNTMGTSNIASPIDDYVMNTSDWIGDGTEAFGACLRSTTATATWTVNATCDMSADGPHWHAIPTVGDATAEIARTANGDGVRVANLRFGLRTATNEPAGELSAGLTYLVVAPAV
jgi:hypothetical protein